ncbi:MAG: hypothetical protein V9G10_13635 [Candidatus Nanopelagicales bacterium]|jgi:hypothetical protein|nr:MAG: hypothetical protein E6Q90_14150 [Actinomycetota bacterium]
MNIIPGILTAAVLIATPGVALADTPAPKPNNGPTQFADVPLKTSNHTISGHSRDWGLDWFELRFDATLKNAVLQVSTQPPKQNAQGVYSMGATQPVALTGKGAGTPDPNSLAIPGQKYAFTQRVEGLKQATTYYYLINLPVGSGFKPVQEVGTLRTEHHSAHSITRRTTALDLDFTASAGSATVSVSTSPQIVGSKLKGSKAVVVKAANGRFSHTFTDLTPGTKYYVLSVANGQQATQRLTETSTKSQQIAVTVEKIKVIDDADNGLRGKGELLFQVRGTNTPDKSGAWGNQFGETSIGSGKTVTPSGSNAPRHTFTTKKDSFAVQVEGREADWVGKSAREFCESAYRQPGENHTARWLNSGDSGAECYQFSHAETAFDLNKGKTQTKTFSVARTPDLRFEVTVRMTMKAV